MRSLRLALILLLPLALTVGDAPDARPAAGGKRQWTSDEVKRFYTEEKDRITTEWVDSPMRQRVFDSFWKAGYIPVMSEGKMENGQEMYRKAFKHPHDVHPDAEGVKAWCNTGLSQTSFRARNREKQNEGYTLMQIQSFVDNAGRLRFCACWVKLPSEEPKK